MKTKPEAKSSFGRTTAMLMGTLALSIVGGILAIGVLYYGQQPASAEPTIPPGVALTSWFDNGAGGQHLLQIRQGSAPPAGARVTGIVATDTNCDPDPQGLSHCHNRIDLGGGRSFEVVNTHIMTRHPCLSPGQRLSIRRLNAEWVIASEELPSRTN